MFSSCCLQGFEWEGKPSGEESVLANNQTYVVGSNPDVAIMVVADLFGWTFNNTRLLADHYAKEVDATVFLPDFFGGELIPLEVALSYARMKEFDMTSFHEKNSKENRWPELLSCVEALRTKYKRVGVIGYCYGGWASFQLGSKKHSPLLVDAISTAHPTFLTHEEMDNIGVPVQILSPETDLAFTPELKAYANAMIPTKNVPYDYQYFPGVEHSFATRGNPNDEKERRAMVRGKNAQVAWMREWLHG